MESIGASERVMEYLDRETAPQLSKGRILPNFRGKVSSCCPKALLTSTQVLVCMFQTLPGTDWPVLRVKVPTQLRAQASCGPQGS